MVVGAAAYVASVRGGLFNSVISTRGVRFMTIDISNFYLMTPLKRPECIRVKINDLPKEIINEYKLHKKVNKAGMVYRGHKRHVRITTGRAPRKRTPRTTPQQVRILPEQTGARAVETHHETDIVHTCRRRLRHQIRWKRTRRPPHERPPRTLSSQGRVDGKQRHRNTHGLGLRQRPGSSVHAGICATGPQALPTHTHKDAIPVHTVSTLSYQVYIQTDVRTTSPLAATCPT